MKKSNFLIAFSVIFLFAFTLVFADDFTIKDSVTSWTYLIVDKSSGNVGINNSAPNSTLQVSGNVFIKDFAQLKPISPPTYSCTSGEAGTLRYDADNNIIIYCNSTAWIGLDGSIVS